MERETGIEPATNSLEGCDSTTELLPPTRPARPAAALPHRPIRPPKNPVVPNKPSAQSRAARRTLKSTASCAQRQKDAVRGGPSPPISYSPRANPFRARGPKEIGGEGRVRTSVARWAADLQSAAIDHSATSPNCRDTRIDAAPETRPLDPSSTKQPSIVC